MHTVAAFQAKTHFSALLDQVENGDQIIITKHGHPVAKLVPISESNPARIRNAIMRLQEFSAGNKLSGLDWKELRDEGRK